MPLRLGHILFSAIALVLGAPASAQTLSSKPIRIVVPVSAGAENGLCGARVLIMDDSEDSLEMLRLLPPQMGMQHLDGRLLIKAHMLTQVDFSIATLSQQAGQPVVAQLLSKSVGHLRVSSHHT